MQPIRYVQPKQKYYTPSEELTRAIKEYHLALEAERERFNLTYQPKPFNWSTERGK
jgi:hypothetical protein